MPPTRKIPDSKSRYSGLDAESTWVAPRLSGGPWAIYPEMRQLRGLHLWHIGQNIFRCPRPLQSAMYPATPPRVTSGAGSQSPILYAGPPSLLAPPQNREGAWSSPTLPTTSSWRKCGLPTKFCIWTKQFSRWQPSNMVSPSSPPVLLTRNEKRVSSFLSANVQFAAILGSRRWLPTQTSRPLDQSPGAR